MKDPIGFPSSEKILVLASTFHDSSIACEVLNESGLSASACDDMFGLCQQLNLACGAAIISEESLRPEDLQRLQVELAEQEAWSDLPIIMLTSSNVAHTNEMFTQSGNIYLLERPFSRLTLIRAVEVALRARRRQYEVRDLLAALKKSKDEAERANIAKTEFLANMSHEIRTPIGAILGFLDLMKNNEVENSEKLNYMGVVERNSQQLLRLIDDILDLSKVEAGKMTIENVEFGLTDMICDLNSIMTFRAAEKGIRFHLSVDTSIPDKICSDPVRLRQILSNVLGNAIKFTNRGTVELNVSFENSFLRFTVKDTGIGISPEQTAKLFRAFSQADMSTTRRFGGTGLGLILSKRLAASLGGDLILLQSEAGVGSIFAVTIKPDLAPSSKLIQRDAVVRVDVGPDSHRQHPALGRLKVLLVEDSLDNQMLIKTFLGQEGADVTTASDGQQGVILALNQSFDVVIMDIQMPIMDGHEATRKLRRSHYLKPVLALTAHAMIEEKKKCIESGFTDFLSKPIQKRQLIDILSQYVGSH